jgi:hypothetical protein
MAWEGWEGSRIEKVNAPINGGLQYMESWKNKSLLMTCLTSKDYTWNWQRDNIIINHKRVDNTRLANAVKLNTANLLN